MLLRSCISTLLQSIAEVRTKKVVKQRLQTYNLGLLHFYNAQPDLDSDLLGSKTKCWRVRVKNYNGHHPLLFLDPNLALLEQIILEPNSAETCGCAGVQENAFPQIFLVLTSAINLYILKLQKCRLNCIWPPLSILCRLWYIGLSLITKDADIRSSVQQWIVNEQVTF